jgi:hypothetical protein
MKEPIRIAMWSGPRNISSAMMRSFGARNDTAVVDEPFYGVYLAKTGLQHPLRAEVLASQSQDWREVAASLLADAPGGKAIFYQKHMTHHMLPDIGCEWMDRCRNAFLIRDPKHVLVSYAAKRSEVELSDIGIVRQHELFLREADRLGVAPPVIDGADVLMNPTRMLTLLCSAIGIEYSDAMLSWPAGRRDTDGVWASAWYGAVEQSTGFRSSTTVREVSLAAELQCIADEALPHYAALAMHRLR